MANDALIDFQGDGASSDSILSYVHIQTAGYSGSYNDYVVPAAANFPLAGLSSLGAAVTPSRYIVRLNFTPFSNANLPILLKDVTSGGTSLTPVTGSPALNQYRWWYSANNNTVSPDVIEFNSGQAGHTIAIDCYAKQSILHSDQMNNPLISGNVSIDGNITVNNSISNTLVASPTNNVTISGISIDQTNNLLELYYGIYNNSANDTTLQLDINGDTNDSHYDLDGIIINNAGIQRWTFGDVRRLGGIRANSYSNGHLIIYFINDKVNMLFRGYSRGDGGASDQNNYYSLFYNQSISSITSLKLSTVDSSNAIGVNSFVKLYKKII